MYAEYSGHAGVELDDVKLAVRAITAHSFTSPPRYATHSLCTATSFWRALLQRWGSQEFVCRGLERTSWLRFQISELSSPTSSRSRVLVFVLCCAWPAARCSLSWRRHCATPWRSSPCTAATRCACRRTSTRSPRRAGRYQYQRPPRFPLSIVLFLRPLGRRAGRECNEMRNPGESDKERCSGARDCALKQGTRWRR